MGLAIKAAGFLEKIKENYSIGAFSLFSLGPALHGRHHRILRFSQRDEHAACFGQQCFARVDSAHRMYLASFGSLKMAFQRQVGEQRCRCAVSDGQCSGHAGLLGKTLYETQQFVEHRRHIAAMHHARRTFKTSAKMHPAACLPVFDPDFHGRRDGIRVSHQRAEFQKIPHIFGFHAMTETRACGFVRHGLDLHGQCFELRCAQFNRLRLRPLHDERIDDAPQSLACATFFVL